MSDNIIKSQARVSDPKFQYLSSSGQQGLVGRLGRRRAALVSGVRSRVSGGRGRGCRLAFSVNLTLNLTLYFFGPQSNLVDVRPPAEPPYEYLMSYSRADSNENSRGRRISSHAPSARSTSRATRRARRRRRRRSRRSRRRKPKPRPPLQPKTRRTRDLPQSSRPKRQPKPRLRWGRQERRRLAPSKRSATPRVFLDVLVRAALQLANTNRDIARQ